MDSLVGKTAIVSGASAGIGRETARLLAKEGAKVYALARRRDRLDELKKEFPELIVPIEADVREEPKTYLSSVGPDSIDILINNAGLALGTDEIDTCATEDLRQMFEVNVFGLIALTQWVLPSMKKKKRGDIVNLGSVAGYQTYRGGSIYNATKFAVRALTEAWRKDLLGSSIRVIGIHPGMVETEFSEVRFRGDRQKAKEVYNGFTALTAEDIAKSILWSLQCPAHVTVESMLIMPTDQAAVGMIHKES